MRPGESHACRAWASRPLLSRDMSLSLHLSPLCWANKGHIFTSDKETEKKGHKFNDHVGLGNPERGTCRVR